MMNIPILANRQDINVHSHTKIVPESAWYIPTVYSIYPRMLNSCQERGMSILNATSKFRLE